MWERIRGKDTEAPLTIVERETMSGVALGTRYGEAYDAVIEQDFETLLKKIRCPALVFAGTGDPLYHLVGPTCDALPEATREEIEGARTFICETHTNEVAELVRGFYQGVAA